MQSLEELITACEIKPDHTPDVQKLEEEWNLYNAAGFESKARELKPKLLFAKACQQLGNQFTIKRPDFEVSINNFPRFPLESNYRSKLPRSGKAVFEVEPSVFKADVPLSILKKTLEAKELGFKPYVWFVSSDAELQQVVDAPFLNADPAIVAYPIVAKEAEREVINNEFGIVLGFWGKDVNEISGLLESKKTWAIGKRHRRFRA